jgi:GTP-binding protein Era
MKNNSEEKKFRSGYVAVLGKPNVGKSTLINFFLGEKLSIVSEKPQTTRDAILGIFSDEQCQIIFVDTPGIHRPTTLLGRHMVSSAVKAGEDADVLLVVVDAATGITGEDREIFDISKRAMQAHAYCWTAVIVNKIDCVDKPRLLPLLEACRGALTCDDYIPVSALSGEHCRVVLEKVKAKLPEGPLYFPPEQLTDKNERFVVAELVREQVLALCREEVPHAVAVEVTAFQDNPGRKTLIKATIYLERPTQKSIVIGENGRMLKDIGSAARREIERFLDRGVYLELWVKVHKQWRKDEVFLRRLGYVPGT